MNSKKLHEWASSDKCDLTLPELRAMLEIFYEEKIKNNPELVSDFAIQLLGLELRFQLDAIGKAVLPVCGIRYEPYKIVYRSLDQIKESIRNIYLIYYPIYYNFFDKTKNRQNLLNNPNEALRHAFRNFILQGNDEDSEIIGEIIEPELSVDNWSNIENRIKDKIKKLVDILFRKEGKKVHYRDKYEFPEWLINLIKTLHSYAINCPDKNIAKRMQELTPLEAYRELSHNIQGAGQKVISLYLRDLYDLNILNVESLSFDPKNADEWAPLIPIDIHVERSCLIPGFIIWHISGLRIRTGFITEYDEEIASLLVESRDLKETIKKHGDYEFLKFILAELSLQTGVDPTKVEKGLWTIGKIYGLYGLEPMLKSNYLYL